MEQHFQGSDFVPIMQPHDPFDINGQQFYCIPKVVWERCVEFYCQHKLDDLGTDSSTSYEEEDEEEETSSTASSSSELKKKKRRPKEIPSRKELPIEGTSYSLIMLGPSCFHTTHKICFMDNANQCNANFKLVRGYLNDEEMAINKSKSNEFRSSLTISSTKTFNCKSRGVYKLVFELDCYWDISLSYPLVHCGRDMKVIILSNHWTLLNAK